MARKPGHTPRGLLALLAAWAVGLPALLHYVGGREAHFGAPVHFWLVATGAVVAAAASVGDVQDATIVEIADHRDELASLK